MKNQLSQESVQLPKPEQIRVLAGLSRCQGTRMDDNDEIVGSGLAWGKEGRGVALAPVTASWGSSPRLAGSQMAVDDSGHFIGKVSGGCVEGEVLETAAQVIATGRPALLKFGVSDEKALSFGLACGGSIEIFVEKLSTPDSFERVLNGPSHGHSTVALVAPGSGERAPVDAEAPRRFNLDDDFRSVQKAEAGGRNVAIETKRGILEFWRPLLRLFIVCAVHIAQSLAPVARLAGYAVTIIDPRTAFATPERFAGFHLCAQWQEVLPQFALDESSALVALTQEPRIDDPASVALRCPAFYIGALGSRSTAEKRPKRLLSQGFGELALSRVHGPIGLAIGAANPAEIAIAIAAEMTSALRRLEVESQKVLGSAAE